MNEKMKNKFDNLFRDYNLNKIDTKSELREKELRRREFMKTFEDMIMRNIVPVMTEIGNHLQENGHGSLIGNHFEHQAIFMNIFPEKKSHNSHPSICFMANESTQKIAIQLKSFMPDDSGYEKDLGEFDPDEITKDFVEHEIFNLIKESFSDYKTSSDYYRTNRWEQNKTPYFEEKTACD